MEILIILILILLNGFFALSEIALVSSKKSRLEKMRDEGRPGAKTALRLYNNSGSFLSAIQVGITLIGIVTGVYGGINIAGDLAPFLAKFSALSSYANEIALGVTIITITYFSIVIGELVPKTIALNSPEKIAVIIAPPVYYFSVAFYPFVKFLSLSTSLINSIIGIRKQPDSITEAELRSLLKTASREGVIEKAQNLIHQKVFYFSDKKAKHIMTHRMDIDWVDINQPYGKIRETVLKARHSRLLCAKGDLDEFQGIINVKDFLVADPESEGFFDPELLIHPIIVPESADVHKVLSLFKEKQIHFCVVVNEFGSLEGIITLYDILENLIGEIPDEGETFEPDIFVRDDKSFLVSGDAPVEVLDGIFENYLTDLEDIDYSTVAGFVLQNIAKQPQVGDKFTFKDHVIEIVDIDGNRIDKVLISRKQ
ncbi:MAG: hemolysin family protein [Bacteroidales bacterium]|nr:hemolysin family protein [Bacteroidales bacterium]